MSVIETYKKYRKTQMKLHQNILDTCVTQDVFNDSVNMMGVIRNGVVVLENETEKEFILHFNIYCHMKDGKNAVSEYLSHDSGANELEKTLLVAMERSEDILYEVVDIQKEQRAVMLRDVLQKSDLIKVVDIGMSKTLRKGSLVFTRLLHLDEFSITTGLGFIFSENHKDYLLKRSKKLMKKVKSGNPVSDKFIAFFMLNRSDGLASISDNV